MIQSHRTHQLRSMAEELEGQQQIRLGVAAERYLVGILPGYFSDANGESRYCDGELHQEIMAAFDYRFPLIGGSAADAMFPITGFQFVDDQCYESGLALALVESGLSFGTAMGHGFRPVYTHCLRVETLADDRLNGYDVSQLDSQQTKQRLEKLRDDGLSPHGRPILGLMSGAECRTLIPLQEQTHGEKYVRFNRKISRGDSLYVLNATPTEMLRADLKFVDMARSRAGVELDDLAAIIVFSCVGRYREYTTDPISWEKAARALCKNSPTVPLIGILCAGEFGVDAWRESRADNLCLSVCCLGRVAARHSRAGDLQNTLLEWADRLAACQSPKKVMETALRGAVEAGALGGQFCIVDYAIGRIMGSGHGYAFSPAGAGQHWPSVLE